MHVSRLRFPAVCDQNSLWVLTNVEQFFKEIKILLQPDTHAAVGPGQRQTVSASRNEGQKVPNKLHDIERIEGSNFIFNNDSNKF